MKLRETAEFKSYAACLEGEGLQALGLAMVGTPASWLVDLMSASVQKASPSFPQGSFP